MELQPLIDGLVYPSEDDRPFDRVDWPAGPTSALAAVTAHVAPGTAIEKLTAAAFFDPLRTTADRDRFSALQRGLAAALLDLEAFRVSNRSAEVGIYLVGRTDDGRWAGVHTVSVET